MSAPFTPYPDVDAILHSVLSQAQAVLGAQFVGMYLFGSLASGDFDPLRSDIDYVVATRDPLPPETVAALRSMHAGIASGESKWARELEGFYIPLEALRRYVPGQTFPSIGVDWPFGVGEDSVAGIIQRYILREHGIVLAGPPPRTLIDPVSAADLRRAVAGILAQWWLPQLADPARLKPRMYQAYAVLTMCRALYTLRKGGIVSKPVAARWAQSELGQPWADLIERALAWQEGDGVEDFPQTLALIRLTLQEANLSLEDSSPTSH